MHIRVASANKTAQKYSSMGRGKKNEGSLDLFMQKRASIEAISEIDMMAMLAAGNDQPMTEPISPVRSNKKAEEINKYINSQVIVPPIVRMQSKKMISMQGKEVKSVAKAQRRRAAAYLHHKS